MFWHGKNNAHVWSGGGPPTLPALPNFLRDVVARNDQSHFNGRTYYPIQKTLKPSKNDFSVVYLNGGEGGIRTLGTLLTYNALAGRHLRPLGHLSVEARGASATELRRYHDWVGWRKFYGASRNRASSIPKVKMVTESQVRRHVNPCAAPPFNIRPFLR